jgi:hypothetical protein
MTNERQHDTDDELAQAIALVEQELGGEVVWSGPRDGWRTESATTEGDPNLASMPRLRRPRSKRVTMPALQANERTRTRSS